MVGQSQLPSWPPGPTVKGNVKDHTGIICEPLIRSLVFPHEQVAFAQHTFPESLCSFSRMLNSEYTCFNRLAEVLPSQSSQSNAEGRIIIESWVHSSCLACMGPRFPSLGLKSSCIWPSVMEHICKSSILEAEEEEPSQG